AGEDAQSTLKSVNWGPSKKPFGKGQLGGKEAAYGGGPPAVPAQFLRIAEVPRTKEAPDDSALMPFNHLASQTVRTFEIVYSGGKTELLLSAKTLDDMGSYADLLYQVYGELELAKTNAAPDFLHRLAGIVGVGL